MTTTGTWPDHPLSLAEWDALPEDTSRRIERVEGVLLVAPRPTPRHQSIATRLAGVLESALAPAWNAVVEVLSPGTRRIDRVLKLAEYAEAGIAHYLLVEPGPPVTMTEFRLTGARYEHVADHRGGVTVDLGVPVAVDLDALGGQPST